MEPVLPLLRAGRMQDRGGGIREGACQPAAQALREAQNLGNLMTTGRAELCVDGATRLEEPLTSN